MTDVKTIREALTLTILTDGAEERSVTLSGDTADDVTVGLACPEVYNALAIADSQVDKFQLTLTLTAEGWGAKSGQIRTECGKGLRSSYPIPCQHCSGRCMGLHPGRAIHYYRQSVEPTLLNGQPLGEQEALLHAGDILSFGHTRLIVNA